MIVYIFPHIVNYIILFPHIVNYIILFRHWFSTKVTVYISKQKILFIDSLTGAGHRLTRPFLFNVIKYISPFQSMCQNTDYQCSRYCEFWLSADLLCNIEFDAVISLFSYIEVFFIALFFIYFVEIDFPLNTCIVSWMWWLFPQMIETEHTVRILFLFREIKPNNLIHLCIISFVLKIIDLFICNIFMFIVDVRDRVL